MTRRIATVRVAKAANMKKRPKPPPRLLTLRPMWMTMVHSTSESSARRKGRRGLVSEHSGRTEVCYSLLKKQKLQSSKLPL